MLAATHRAQIEAEWRASVITGRNAWLDHKVAECVRRLHLHARTTYDISPSHADVAYWLARTVWRAGLQALQWGEPYGNQDA